MRIVICEAAVNHPDGTYSVLRGGIDRFDEPALPFHLRAAMLIEAPVDEVPAGDHEIKGSITLPDGRSVPVGGKYRVMPGSVVMRFALPLDLPIEATGMVVIALQVGSAEATATITIGKVRRRPGTGGGD